MNKKDKTIEKYISDYTELVKPDISSTEKAKQMLSLKAQNQAAYGQSKSEREKSPKKFVLKFVGIGMSFVLIFSVLAFVISKTGIFTSPTSPPTSYNVSYYKSSQIYKKTESAKTVEEIGGKKLLKFNFKNAVSEYKVYRLLSDNEVASIRNEIDIITPTGLDKIVVISEMIENAVYEKNQSYLKLPYFTTLENAKINGKEEYIDGEFVARAVFSKKKITYFVYVMSNTSGRIDLYLDELLK